MRESAFPISIVLATYNWPEALEHCLRSLSVQTDTHFDIVIADDGSRADTRQLIERLTPQMPVPIKHLWQEDIGFRKSKILNQALKAASGEYLIFLDADCIVQSDFVAQHRALAHTGQMVTGSRILLSENYTKELCKEPSRLFVLSPKKPFLQRLLLTLKLRLGGGINKALPLLITLPDLAFRKYDKHVWRRIKGCNMACWRQDALTIGGFNEDFEGWGHEDADFVFRLEDAGVQRKSGSCATEVFHLWHKTQSKEQAQINKERVMNARNKRAA
jgi:GT2 family glycosyltransferase